MVFNYQEHLDWICAQQTRMRDELLRLANINSGSSNVDGIAAVGERLRALLEPLAGPAEVLTLAPYAWTDDGGRRQAQPIGKALRFRCRREAPLQILLAGHLDTVFPADHPFQTARQTAPDTVHGPGVADLKGGLLVMYLALAVLERSPWKQRIGWEVLLNPDEEIGSQGSAPLFEEAAARHDFGLVFEPSLPDGSLATARKGSGNFDVIIHGRAAHAGRNPEQGRNAVRAAADFIAALDQLNGSRDGVTINPGYVHGGGPLNIVPELCVFKFNIRTRDPEDEVWMQERLSDLQAELLQRDGFRIELRGGFTRPPKPMTPPIQRLVDLLADSAAQLGLPLQFKPTGGCCDGNNLAAAGLPNIDNLGVVGGEIHSDREFMRLSSITERAQLSALLLLRLASNEISWP